MTENSEARKRREEMEPVKTVYERFIEELDGMTIMADQPAASVVGELTRAVKRAQNSWEADR